MVRDVHQFHPVVTYGDAISNQAIAMRKFFRAREKRSEIFGEYPQPGFEERAFHFKEYRKYSSSENALLLHYSIAYSPEVLAWIEKLPDKKVLVYHNITPPHYFRRVNSAYHEAAWLGREQLRRLSAIVDAVWCDSAFNREEIAAIGWKETHVFPIILDPAFYDVAPDRATARRLQSSEGPRILFVGRIVPNKRIEDLIVIFDALRRHAEPAASLHLVGSFDQMETYKAYLDALIARLGCSGVTFHGKVTKEQLVAFYRHSDLFLGMSEHEGFCVPLIESMYFGLPIVAYAAAAVPETLGGAGVLLLERDHEAIAELLSIFLADRRWREEVIAGQRERVRRFLPESVGAELCRLVERIG